MTVKVRRLMGKNYNSDEYFAPILPEIKLLNFNH